MTEEKIRCPKCNSEQITADKKGFQAGKAIVGGILTGGIGLLAGFHGSKKLVLYCMACGNKFKPGEKPKPELTEKEKEGSGVGCAIIGGIIGLGLILWYFLSE